MKIWLDTDENSFPLQYADMKGNGFNYWVLCKSIKEVKYFITSKEVQFDNRLAGMYTPDDYDVFDDLLLDIMVDEISISDKFDKDEVENFIQWLNDTRRDKYNITIGYHNHVYA